MDGFNSAKYDSTNDPYGNEKYKAIENEAEAEIARLEDDYKARLRDLEKWKRKERDILNRRTKSRKRELDEALEAERERSKARQQQSQEEQAATRPGQSFPESVHGDDKNILISPTRQRSLSPPPLSSKRARYRPPPRHIIEHSPAEILASIEEIPIYKQLIRNYFIYVPGTSVPVKLHHFLNFKDQMKRFYPRKC